MFSVRNEIKSRESYHVLLAGTEPKFSVFFGILAVFLILHISATLPVCKLYITIPGESIKIESQRYQNEVFGIMLAV